MKLFYILLIVFISYDFPLLAQRTEKDTLKLKDTVNLKEVIVTGVQPPEKDKSVVPMQSVSGDELDRLSGNSVADAIKDFSGIVLKDYGGIGGLKTVMVRSLGANHTGVFVDDVPFSDAASGQIDLGKITIDNVSNVSLVIGQPTTVCQTARFYASASVISIQSAEPDFQFKPYLIKAGVKIGSFGLINPVISLQNKLGKKTYSDISINYIKANGEYPFLLQNGNKDTVETRHNSDIESINLNAALITRLPDRSKLSFRLYYYGSDRGLPGAVIYYNSFSDQRMWNRDFFSNIQLKSDAKQRLQWFTNVKFSQSWLRYLDPEYLNTAGVLDNRYLQREYYISQVLTWKPIDSLFLSLASDYFINTLNANLYQFAQPTRYSSLTVLALQYSKREIEVDGNLLGTMIREKTMVGPVAKPYNIVTPSLSMGYKLTRAPAIKIRMLYKEIFRMPTFNDLYYTLVGNNNLQPEYAWQYNLGIIGFYHFGVFEYVSFKTDAFYNFVKDKIVAVPTQNLFVWSMRNIGEVSIKGLELQAQAQTHPIMNIRYVVSCNYTFQQALDVTSKNSATYDQQIPYIPFENFSAMGAVLYKSFSVNYNLLYNGYCYVLGQNINTNILAPWCTSDISALYEFKKKTYALKLKGEVNNIYNKQYEIIQSFPMPGRSYSITITLIY